MLEIYVDKSGDDYPECPSAFVAGTIRNQDAWTAFLQSVVSKELLKTTEVNNGTVAKRIGKMPKKITEEEYLAQRGCPFMDGAEPALHRTPGGLPKHSRKKLCTLIQSRMSKNNSKRDELRKEYMMKVNAGDITLPSRTERLIKTAGGHDDLEAVQAARRILIKQGINW